jgi:peptide/nickel transport system permease protein
MIRHVAKRFLWMIPLLLSVTFVSFMLVQLMPGDAFTRLEMNPDLSAATLERFRAAYGLDRPLLVQYGHWLWGVVSRGDFGVSVESGLPAFDALFLDGRLGWTILVSSTTLLIVWMTALPVGVYAAARERRGVDRVANLVAVLGISVPGFLLGLVLLWLLVAVFRVGDHGLGVGGLFDNEFIGRPLSWAKVGSVLWHLWPVWIVIGVGSFAGWMRQVRGNLLDVLRQPFMLVLRAKGVGEHAAIWRHGLRHAANPLISMLGMTLPFLVSGSLLASVVFNLPTVERAFWSAIQAQDPYVVLAGLVFFTLFLALGNLFADVLLFLIDPRVRGGAV